MTTLTRIFDEAHEEAYLNGLNVRINNVEELLKNKRADTLKVAQECYDKAMLRQKSDQEIYQMVFNNYMNEIKSNNKNYEENDIGKKGEEAEKKYNELLKVAFYKRDYEMYNEERNLIMAHCIDVLNGPNLLARLYVAMINWLDEMPERKNLKEYNEMLDKWFKE